MGHLVKLWRTLPVVIRAVAAGVTVAAVGTGPWAGLVSANVRHSPRVPWAVPITAAYLTIYWGYCVRGAVWPVSTGASRRGFSAAIAAFLVATALTIWAFAALSRVTRSRRTPIGAAVRFR